MSRNIDDQSHQAIVATMKMLTEPLDRAFDNIQAAAKAIEDQLTRLPLHKFDPPIIHTPLTKRGSVKFRRNYVEAWHTSDKDGTKIHHKRKFKSARAARRHLLAHRFTHQCTINYQPLVPAQFIRCEFVIGRDLTQSSTS